MTLLGCISITNEHIVANVLTLKILSPILIGEIIFSKDQLYRYNKSDKSWRYDARHCLNKAKIKDLRDFSWYIVQKEIDGQSDIPKEVLDLVLDMINFRIAQFDNLKKKDRSKVFLRIYFSGKAVERINFSSILHKNQEFIPEQFQFREPPTVLYKRTKPIGSDIFNYKATVDEVLTEDWPSSRR